MSYFSSFLKNIMIEKNIGVNELAKISGVSGAHISRILNEKRSVPSPKTIKKLAIALNANYDDLMYAAGHIDLYKAFSIVPEAFIPSQKAVFGLITEKKREHGDILTKIIAQKCKISQEAANKAIDSFAEFQSLSVDLQSQIFNSMFKLPPLPNKKTSKIDGIDAAHVLYNGFPENSMPVDGFIKVPVVGRIPAGNPLIAIESVEGYEDIPRGWINGDPTNYFILKVEGDSMEGAKIFDGDLALIKKCPTFENGQICAVGVTGETPDLYATLKRVFDLDDEYIELVPENSKYPRRKVKRSEVNIFGTLKIIHRKF